MEKLQKDETDAWGTSYKKGASIIRRNYFKKIDRDVFRYRRMISKPAIVPADAVIFICHELKCVKGCIELSEPLHLGILAVVEDVFVLN